MKTLVIDGGARGHAIVSGLARSPLVTKIWCAPGNAGTETEKIGGGWFYANNEQIPAHDVEELVKFALEHKPDLTVVGSEVPLSLGLVDRLQKLGLKVFGPSQRAALFESSKIFAHNFMKRWRIPSPEGRGFDCPREALAYAHGLFDDYAECVVKADGLAAGKGARICLSRVEAREAIRESMIENKFGAAGHRVLIQQKVRGVECSEHILFDGTTLCRFPKSHDYKRLLDDDEGPMTGGMGAYSLGTPEPLISMTGRHILEPWREGCEAEEITYRGLLYPGLMVSDQNSETGYNVLEFNSRFGDPETEVYIPRLESDLAELLLAVVEGNLNKINICWSSDACVGVVMATREYPNPSVRGHPITGISDANKIKGVKVFHASTFFSDTHDKHKGYHAGEGRVLVVTGKGPTLESARQTAYAGVECIKFEGMQYRKKIALLQ